MAAQTHSPLGRLLPRQVQSMIEEALGDTRVVLVNGARQSGKSTLVKLIGSQRGAVQLDLDRPSVRLAARQDPTGFVDRDTPLVIDEIQRDPELLLAIKVNVDEDQRPGRFLLTGSARVLGLRDLPDSLVGRMETIELWPFSQGELDGAPDRFVDALFTHGPTIWHTSELRRSDYVDRVIRGGFPESVARPQPRRRQRFLDSYVADLINRDVLQLAEIERSDELRKLIQLVAARTGQLLVSQQLAAAVGVSAPTVKRHLGLLEETFLLKRVPAWSRSTTSRVTRTPKIAMVDSGLAANLQRADIGQLLQPGNSQFGGLLESFVLMELARQLTWSDESVELYHFRTRDKVEVDAVLENRRGQVVGIEVKASATPRSEDFRGLRHLAERLGDDFIAGIVLHTGDQTLPFGPKLRAMPVSAVWELAP